MRHARIIPAAALLSLLLLGGAPGRMQSPPVDMRFQWIDGIENQVYREAPGVLSRPAPADTPCDIPSDAPAIFSGYPTSAEVIAFLDSLNAAYPDLSERFQAGVSRQGRPIAGIRLGNEGSGDPDARPALYLDGQHHAREAIAKMAVLYTVWWLLSRYGQDPIATRLLDTRTVYAIPSVNPDGNDLWLTTDFSQRRNANPTCCDDDWDGRLDEDPANGMGWGTFQLFRYTFDAGWIAAHPDNPFVPGWESHLLSINSLGVVDGEDNPIPQVDDDHDNSRLGLNEDPIGGVDLNRNYDAHWELGESNPIRETYRGPAIWSEPESRAVRDWVLAHANVLVGVSLHSGADVILHPWGWSQTAPLLDGMVYERLARKGSQLTEGCGFLGSSHAWTARGLYLAPGTTMDWLYGQGVYAFIPEIYSASLVAKFRRDSDPAYPASFLVYSSLGVAFNPDDSEILQVCERWRPYLLYLLAAVPSPALASAEIEGNALVIRASNDGGIPIALALEAATESGQTFSAEVNGLRGREFAWRLPLETFLEHTATLTMTATTLMSSFPRDFSPTTLRFRASEEGVEILEGNARPFVPLHSFFGEGGWDADSRRWEQGYHFGEPIGYRLMFPFVLN